MSEQLCSKWLVVSPHLLLGDFPRNIRVRNIAENVEGVETHALALNYGNSIKSSSIIYHLYEPSVFHRLILEPATNYVGFRRLLRKVFKLGAMVYRMLFILTDWNVLERRRIVQYIVNLDSIYHFERIIFSVLPYSLFHIVLDVVDSVGGKLVIDIGDPFYRNSVYPLAGLKSQLRKSLERKAALSVSKLIVTNQETSKLYQLDYGVNGEDIYVIPQGYSPHVFYPLENLNGIEGRTIQVHYYGALYQKLREIKYLEEAIDKHNVKNSAKGFALTVFGSSKQVSSKKTRVEEPVPQLLLPEVMSKADILLFIDNAYGIQTSGKIFELLATRKPIIFLYNNENSNTYQIIKAESSNVFFCINETSSILNLLDTLYSIKDMKPVTFPVERYSWRSLSVQYQSMI